MASDLLLNEIERQEKYLAELPPDFGFPLFNTKRALESQRQNGYRNTAVAAREIVDNAFEAGASAVHVVMDSRKNRSKEVVSAVAFIDNGAGMVPKMARFALSWGGGTHFDDPNFIGKFGFGLPNASINQTQVVEVYTRTKPSEPITKAWLNLAEYGHFSQQSVPEPTTGDLPEFVKRYMKDTGLSFDHGTVVVWVNPDRLTYRMPQTLAEHLIDDFGVAYRYLLDGRQLIVRGTPVEPVDPLFLDPRGRYYVKPEDGGAREVIPGGLTISAKFTRDEATGSHHLEKVNNEEDVNRKDPNLLSAGTIHIRVARLSYGFAAGGKGSKDAPEEAKRRFEIRQSRRGMSFVRAGREIETLDAFPRSARDRASGLGEWPHLQGYAYHWGIEVRFGPELDEAFGITNDKQRVRPIEDFWRLLVEAKVDEILNRENRWQQKTRKVESDRIKADKAKASDSPSPAEEAAAAVPTITGKRVTIPDRSKPMAREKVDEQAVKSSKVTQQTVEAVKQALELEAKRRPFKIDYFDDVHGPFYKPEWFGPQVVVWVNRKHAFYETLYGDLLMIRGGLKAKEALDVLLIALAKAELELDNDLSAQFFEHQRVEVWSKFLSVGLKNLAGMMESPDEPEEGDEAA